MLKSKLGKRLAASTAALAMAVSASASSLAALTAHAGMLLGEGTFNDGAGLPWHICESATGKMQFSVVDGVYAIKIENPGGASKAVRTDGTASSVTEVCPWSGVTFIVSLTPSTLLTLVRPMPRSVI